MHILILEDDSFYLKRIEKICKDYGLVTPVSSPQKAIDYLENTKIDLVITDIDLNDDFSGLDIARKALNANIDTFILSNHDKEEVVEEAYLIGCKHFLHKKKFATQLPIFLEKYAKKKSIDFYKLFEEQFITANQGLINKITKLLKSNLKNKTILLTGETGTGKTQIAKTIHQATAQAHEPFIHLNCSEISENLLESELFGHTKGSFTGALENKKGKLELAHGGVLFLDEVSSMPISMQQKLLRVLEEKTFYPVGSNKLIRSEFTLITATCDNLFEMISLGKFRQDLFFRISGYNLEIPPLRERKEDILKIVDYFKSLATRKVIFKDRVIQAMYEYSWPGNVRELIKTIEQLIDNSKGIIEVQDFQSLMQNIFIEQTEDHFLNSSQESYIFEHGLRSFIKMIEKDIAKKVFAKHHGKITHCIKELKISNSAFYRILEQTQL